MAKINKIKTISFRLITQLTLTYSNLTIETLQKDVKYVQKLTVKAPEWRQWRRSGAFIVNFAHISNLFLVFLSLPLNM